jgi:hypothetical protein
MTNGEEFEAMGFGPDRRLVCDDYDFSHLCFIDTTEEEIDQLRKWADNYEGEEIGCVIVRVEEMFDEPAYTFVVIGPGSDDELSAKIEEAESTGIH